ncbi:MAG: hypothetical protein WA154_14365 [Moraxellaceae bacterium]
MTLTTPEFTQIVGGRMSAVKVDFSFLRRLAGLEKTSQQNELFDAVQSCQILRIVLECRTFQA